MDNLTSKKWWEAAGVRAIKTAAQSAIAAMPTTAVTLGSVNWEIVVSSAALAAVLSLLTSIAGLPEVKEVSDGGDADSDAE